MSGKVILLSLAKKTCEEIILDFAKITKDDTIICYHNDLIKFFIINGYGDLCDSQTHFGLKFILLKKLLENPSVDARFVYDIISRIQMFYFEDLSKYLLTSGDRVHTELRLAYPDDHGLIPKGSKLTMIGLENYLYIFDKTGPDNCPTSLIDLISETDGVTPEIMLKFYSKGYTEIYSVDHYKKFSWDHHREMLNYFLREYNEKENIVAGALFWAYGSAYFNSLRSSVPSDLKKKFQLKDSKLFEMVPKESGSPKNRNLIERILFLMEHFSPVKTRGLDALIEKLAVTPEE